MLAGMAGLAAAPGAAPAAPRREASFHHDHVLGTSLDGWVIADGPAAARAEQVVLAEIERLRRVFSPFDPDSELARLNRSAGPFAASADLLAVLGEYEVWQRRSGGACSAGLGDLVRLWEEAGRTGNAPDGPTLAALSAQAARPGWSRDAAGRVVRTAAGPLNLNSLAKGYILHKASLAVRANVPGAAGLLLDLGGDLTGWGPCWTVGVQDPRRPAENARPLTALRLQNAAVASSGGYQRFVTVGGVRRSHLLDPRTGRPADGVAGATVVAPTSTLANVLATTLCVLAPAEGLRLAASHGAQCLLVTAAGCVLRSKGFAALEARLADDKARPAEKPAKDAWPAGFEVSVALELPRPRTGRRIRRPYVAVWVEDGAGKAVRSLTVWGNKRKWLPTMSGWWKVANGDQALVRAVTRATRAPGKYTVVWDGKDDQGKALPQGTYTIRVEVHREHGKHLFQTGKIACLAEPASLTLEKNAETADTVVTYGKRK
jgi:thiamine biosynthesis lipoprotein ApbE